MQHSKPLLKKHDAPRLLLCGSGVHMQTAWCPVVVVCCSFQVQRLPCYESPSSSMVSPKTFQLWLCRALIPEAPGVCKFPNFAAPELVLGEVYTINSKSSSHHICAKAQDIWALSCVAYWAFVGHGPFQAHTPKLCMQEVHEQHETWVRAAPDWHPCSSTDSFRLSSPSHAPVACFTV